MEVVVDYQTGQCWRFVRQVDEGPVEVPDRENVEEGDEQLSNDSSKPVDRFKSEDGNAYQVEWAYLRRSNDLAVIDGDGIRF